MKRRVALSCLAMGGLAVVALWQTGCARSAPSHFYVLSTMLPPPATVSPEVRVGLWVDPLPDYLRHPELVTRHGPNEVAYHDFQRWAEPLDVAVPTILAQNLARALGQPTVLLYPWTAATPPSRIYHVQIERFEADPAGTVTLVADVAVGDTWHQHTITCQAESAAPGDVVAALSQALAQLAQRMAKSEKATGQGRP